MTTELAKQAAKPGWKSSEFWMSAAAFVVGLLLQAGAFGDDSIWAKGLGVAAQALAAVGYSVSRAVVKKSAGK